VFAGLVLLTQLLAYQRFRISREVEHQKIIQEANNIRDRFRNILGNSISATRTLAFIVDKYGVAGNFDSIAAAILETNKFIDAIQLTDQGVITHVYPLKGNEAVVGFDIFQDSLSSVEAFKAVRKRELFFAGPFKLKQGGFAVVGRLPIYQGAAFRRFVVVIIKFENLLRISGINEQEGEFEYELAKVNPHSGQMDYFLHGKAPNGDRFASVDVPDGEWKLFVARRTSSALIPGVVIFSLLGLIFSVVAGVFTWHLVRQPEKLNRLVKVKTAEVLRHRQAMATTLERVSDAFVSLDRNWRYTFMNRRAGEIFNRDPDEMIGREIWAEFPEAVGLPWYDAYRKAFQEQKYLSLEQYFEPNKLWIETHIYPSPDGLSVYFRDITESKRAAQRLEASEKYFRTLIEKSSDAIILLDSEGHITFASPSVARITGYSAAELKEMYSQDLVTPRSYDEHLRTFQQVAESPGASATITFKFTHKSGHKLWIEGTYTNWLEDESISAIVLNCHDVSGRIESEEKIRSANRLYQFTARINQMMIHVTDELTLYQEVCHIAVDAGKFRMAWIGSTDTDATQITRVVHAGVEDGYLESARQIYMQMRGSHEGPLERAIRQGAYCYCNDVATDPLMAPYAREALRRNYRASIALPIKKFNKVVGVFTIYSEEAYCFDDDEINLLQEATRNISFTLETLETQQLRRRAEEQRENEKQLSDSIINSLPGVFYLFDRQGRFVRWNRHFSAVSGYSDEEIMEGMPLLYFHPDDHPLLRERIEAVFQTGYADVTANFYTKDKRLIPYFFNGQKVTFDNVDYVIGMGIDITHRVRAENELKETTEEIQKLTAHLQHIREEERTGIAREIHDVLGQQLTALKMDTSWLRKNITEGRAVERLGDMAGLIDETIKAVRKISSELRPGVLDDLGLVAALEWQTSQFEKNTGIKASFKSSVSELPLGGSIATNIFRIYQEALTNVARHSGATGVHAYLAVADGVLELNVRDNGTGFDMQVAKQKKSLGIIGMRERARLFHGELEIGNNLPSGTVLHLKVPLSNNLTEQS
jgi:PAS domain S-box-containing protein